MTITLNNIRKTKANNRKRVGRGIGSGTGKTSGHGVKGQKARSGVALKLFEGGQTPIYMRLPKKGFRSQAKKSYQAITIKDVLAAIEKNKIKDSNLTKEILFNLGLVRDKDSIIKLIMGGLDVESKNLTIQADFYSKKAQSFSS
jgi:large subunit ribosomal protein L15